MQARIKNAIISAQSPKIKCYPGTVKQTQVMQNTYIKNILLCTQVLQLITEQKKSLDIAVQDVLSKHSDAHSNLIYSIARGTCQYYHQTNQWLSNVCKIKPKDTAIRHVLNIALYQCHHMNRKNPRTVINAAVACADKQNRSWAKGIIKAVLERSMREGIDQHQTAASQLGLPEWIYHKLLSQYPKNEVEALAKSWLEDRNIVGVRTNSPNMSKNQYIRLLEKTGVAWDNHTSWPQCITVNKQGLKDLPGLAEGLVYIQDPINQFMIQTIPKLKKSSRVLDACCAPGGKTGALLCEQPNLELLALDKSGIKQERTASNTRHFSSQVRIQTGDACQPETWWDGIPFQVILADVPCTAICNIGQFPEIRLIRQEKDYEELQEQQRNIITALWPLLSEDGYLLYSTCSLLDGENFKMISDLQNRLSNLHIHPLKNPVNGSMSYRGVVISPDHFSKGGFFCLLQRKSQKSVDNVNKT